MRNTFLLFISLSWHTFLSWNTFLEISSPIGFYEIILQLCSPLVNVSLFSFHTSAHFSSSLHSFILFIHYHDISSLWWPPSLLSSCSPFFCILFPVLNHKHILYQFKLNYWVLNLWALQFFQTISPIFLVLVNIIIILFSQATGIHLIEHLKFFSMIEKMLTVPRPLLLPLIIFHNALS